MFYLNPRLGVGKPTYLEKVHIIPYNTVQNWISAQSFAQKWSGFSESLTIEDFISTLPTKLQGY